MEHLYIVLWAPNDDRSKLTAAWQSVFHEKRHAEMYIELEKAKGSGLTFMIAEAVLLPDHDEALDVF